MQSFQTLEFENLWSPTTYIIQWTKSPVFLILLCNANLKEMFVWMSALQ